MFEQFHEPEIIDAHRGLSDAGILCSRNLWVFIIIFDWYRLPIAEAERHYIRNGCNNQNMACECIDVVHAIDYALECLIQYLVQTATAPPT